MKWPNAFTFFVVLKFYLLPDNLMNQTRIKNLPNMVNDFHYDTFFIFLFRCLEKFCQVFFELIFWMASSSRKIMFSNMKSGTFKSFEIMNRSSYILQHSVRV